MHYQLLLTCVYLFIFILSLFAFWQSMTAGHVFHNLKYKNGRPVLPEHVFDIWIVTGILSLAVARLSYILSNISLYKNTEWAFTPWKTEFGEIFDQRKVEWFTHFPWKYLNVYEGIDVSAFLLAFILIFLIIVSIRGLELKIVLKPFTNGIVLFAVLLVASALFIPTVGLINDRLSGNMSPKLIRDNLSYPFIVILIIAFVLLNKYFLKNDKRRLSESLGFRLHFLSLSLFYSILILLIRIQQEYEVRFLFASLIPLAIGLFIFVFSASKSREALLRENSEFVNEDQSKPAASLEIDLGKTKNFPNRKKTNV